MRTSTPLVVAGLLICALAARPGAQTTLPGPPVPFTARVDGLTVTVSWTEPQEGRPIQFYILEMGTAPGVYSLGVPWPSALIAVTRDVSPACPRARAVRRRGSVESGQRDRPLMLAQ